MSLRSGAAGSARRGTRGGSARSLGGWMWPVALTLFGVLLLLDNFLLLGDFNAAALLPLLLVMVGAQILLRGDFVLNEDVRRFGITRGSVESATLEISSGEVDIEVRPLQADWRLKDGQSALIAGQFAAQSRPQLTMAEQHAHLKMDRAATPWASFADWQIGLANDLPWQLLASASLGQITLDLTGVIVHEVIAASGIGDIHLISPVEAFRPLHLRTTFGNLHLTTPLGYRTRITVRATRFFSVKVDETRYDRDGMDGFVALDAAPDAPLVEIHLSGTFGDAYLA